MQVAAAEESLVPTAEPGCGEVAHSLSSARSFTRRVDCCCNSVCSHKPCMRLFNIKMYMFLYFLGKEVYNHFLLERWLFPYVVSINFMTALAGISFQGLLSYLSLKIIEQGKCITIIQ